jgi:hypothetical protein
MTLEYLEITQQDLQREFYWRSPIPGAWRHPRPSPLAPLVRICRA